MISLSKWCVIVHHLRHALERELKMQAHEETLLIEPSTPALRDYLIVRTPESISLCFSRGRCQRQGKGLEVVSDLP